MVIWVAQLANRSTRRDTMRWMRYRKEGCLFAQSSDWRRVVDASIYGPTLNSQVSNGKVMNVTTMSTTKNATTTTRTGQFVFCGT